MKRCVTDQVPGEWFDRLPLLMFIAGEIKEPLFCFIV